MILNRALYNKISPWRAWWHRRQASKLRSERSFKAFDLHQTEFSTKLFFYSPRFKRVPRFTGDQARLSNWKDARICETICPTYAIKVTASAIIIDDRGCIACGLCVGLAPEGILEVPTEFSIEHRS